MNKIALALILLILPFSLAYTSPRKKVGIVLSGGGAKGVAHIGVIKALEELNIPIDYIAGTSIGAIIGGLYSIGYTSEQLETIVKQTDWINLLTDKVSREKIPFPFKSNDSKYLVSFPFNNSEKNGGIIKGKNISQLLHQLTEGYQNVTNFDSLPIPFACIATDMARNQKEVIRFGKLSEAMRASMAVPIVFSPIYSGQKVLIDGGFKDNLPIDVVKSMGADIIIGIDVQSELSDADNLHSIAGIANQLMLMICQSSLDESTKDIDAYIKVDVENYNAASFTKAAIDTLIIRGENAAKANYNTLLSIKNRIGIVNNKRNNKKGRYVIEHQDLGAKPKKVSKVTIVVLIIVILAAAIALKMYFLGDLKDNKATVNGIEKIDSNSTNNNSETNNKNDNKKHKKVQSDETQIKGINWKDFSKDTKAVLEIPGMLEYPVVQSDDNNYYLHRGLDKKYL